MNFIKRCIASIKQLIQQPFSWKNMLRCNLLGIFVGVFGPLMAILISFTIFHADLPTPEKVEDYSPPLITKIYSSDGVVLRKFAGEKRIWVSLKKISPHLLNALLATEDRRFHQHWGIDLWRVLKAFYVDLKTLSYAQGASTITQQLARSLFLSRERVLTRKIKEALTAIRLERQYTKEEILELYLNQNYMGAGAYGVQAASQEYFNKDVSQLTIDEAAVLAGLIKAPGRYCPKTNKELARQRRNVVLSCMASEGHIDQSTADSLKDLDIELAQEEDKAGKAPYFVAHIRKYLERKYGKRYIYGSGANIYTTLNWELQDTARKVLKDKIDKLQSRVEANHHKDDTVYTKLVFDSTKGESVRVFKQLQGSLVLMEPSTGYIRAMVGGYDFSESKFNRATQALRQPGSAFKPFVYTVAIDNGWSTTDKLRDTPLVLKMSDGEMWRPQNYDRKYKGPTTLRDGLKHSRNIIAIKLIRKVTPKQVIRYAHRMGIKNEIPTVPSIAIGACEVKLINMVKAYSVFANLGVKIEPIYITEQRDRYGKVVEKNLPRREVVLPKPTAYVMVDMLKSVIKGGTGVRAKYAGFDFPGGGKTGTTNDYTDAWFLGFTKYYCCGVRVGFDEMIPLGEDQTGSKAALPIWTKVMLSAHKGKKKMNFKKPDKVVTARVCTESYKLATTKCPDATEEVFIKGQEPTNYCPLPHRSPKDSTLITTEEDEEDSTSTPFDDRQKDDKDTRF